MAGMPISSSGTPAAASARAMASFSSTVNVTPAVCSPSRSVVSLTMIGGSGMAGGPEKLLAGHAEHRPCQPLGRG
jgi:hypothetical protein